MLNLLRADWLKIKRDKSLKVALIITVILAVLNIVLLLLLPYILKIEGVGDDLSEIGMSFDFNAKQAFLNSFSLTNNFGPLIPIIICLFVGKEFTYGTIRNKLISGAKRSHIYFSNLISSAIIGFVLLFIYAGLSLLIGVAALGYGSEFNIHEFLFLLKIFGLGYLLFLFVISLALIFIMITRNQVVSLVLSILTILILGSIASMLIMVNSQIVKDILSFIPFYQSAIITQNLINNEITIKIIYMNIFLIIALNAAGIIVFKKIDIK